MYHDHSFVTLSHTDAAGVTFFAAYFVLAHQTYERFLYKNKLGLNQWLNRVHLPIVHSEASYQAPLFLGDPLCITMGTTKVGQHSFKLKYQFHAWQRETWIPVAHVQTTHVAVLDKKATPSPTSLMNLLNTLGEFNDHFVLDPPSGLDED